jgi:hypothetical protein
MDNQPGCLVGLLKLTLLRWVYNGLQRVFGFGSNSCMGCGCGVILFIIFVILALSILFGTNWLRLTLGPSFLI